MKKPYCCFIGCDKDAAKVIYGDETAQGIALYDSYTHSCDEHTAELGEMYNKKEICDIEGES